MWHGDPLSAKVQKKIDTPISASIDTFKKDSKKLWETKESDQWTLLIVK